MRAHHPDEHSTTTAPAVMDVFDADGDEYATLPPSFGGSVRAFRAAPGAGPNVAGDINLSNDTTTRAGAHLDRGRPDERRQDTSRNGHPSGEPSLAVAPETYRNAAEAVVIEHPNAAPARPRHGSTGADPTRIAWFRRPFLLRPFDKAIAEHPGTVEKIGQPSPRAATPRQLADLSDAYPSAGGHTGTQAEGVGPTRNTFRVTPRAWDSLLVSTTDPAPAAQTTTSRGRTFR